MQGNAVKILSTRPVDERSKRDALDQGIVIDELSFIKTDINPDQKIWQRIASLSNQHITAVFTSMTAVGAISKYILEKPSWDVYCIGTTTASLAEKLFSEENIRGTGENALQLSRVIIEDAPSNVVFFCGDQRRNELPEALHIAGIEVEELVVYTTTGTPQTLLLPYDGILFFSPSAADSFFSANCIAPGIPLFAIGTTTAAAIRNYTQNEIITAGIAGKSGLVQLMIHHFRELKNN
ncbi:MAG: uroporphyrinogen-III synthase [Ginsengibacter sp.]